MKNLWITTGIASANLIGSTAAARLSERLSNVHESFLEDRRAALPSLSDPFGVPTAARVVLEQPRDKFQAQAAWKRNVIATVFWVGELPTENNPTPNTMSAWDQNWQANFGGYDHPENRSGYLPAGFTPALNPFYIALPYNDVAKGGVHRPEASDVIPWFWESYRGDGISVCKGRWVAIHHEGKVCFAQWEDVGPFEVVATPEPQQSGGHRSESRRPGFPPAPQRGHRRVALRGRAGGSPRSLEILVPRAGPAAALKIHP
jgi:hypothetical protein